MTSTSRKFLFMAVILGLAYVAYNHMIKPANQSLTAQKLCVETKLAKLNELSRATAAADDLTKQLEQVEQAIKVFESKLPPESEIHKVLENVTIIAQKHGLTPKTIRTLKTSNNRGYIEQPLKMELDGDFNAYYCFLLELEKMDRITQIKEMTLKKKSKYEGQTDATFVMSIFFQNTKT